MSTVLIDHLYRWAILRRHIVFPCQVLLSLGVSHQRAEFKRIILHSLTVAALYKPLVLFCGLSGPPAFHQLDCAVFAQLGIN